MANFIDEEKDKTNVMPIDKDGTPCRDVNIIMAYILANSTIQLTTINNHETEGISYIIDYPSWINNYKQSTIDQLKKIIKEQLDIYFKDGTPVEFIEKMRESKESFTESVYDRENFLQKQREKDKLLLIEQVIKEMKVNKQENTYDTDSNFTIDFPPWLYSGKYNKFLVKEVTETLTQQTIKSLSEMTRLTYKCHSSRIVSAPKY